MEHKVKRTNPMDSYSYATKHDIKGMPLAEIEKKTKVQSIFIFLSTVHH